MITPEDQVFHSANFLIMGLSDGNNFTSPKPFSAAIPIEVRPMSLRRLPREPEIIGGVPGGSTSTSKIHPSQSKRKSGATEKRFLLMSF
jgi:hypothetical protein